MDISVGLRYRIAMAVLYSIQLTNAISFNDQKAHLEPHCYSRFDYEFKVVQKLVALEDTCSHLKTTTDNLKTEIDKLKNELIGNFLIITILLLISSSSSSSSSSSYYYYY